MTPNNQIIAILMCIGTACISSATFLAGFKLGLLGTGLLCMSMAYQIMRHTRRD
jgi:hypothetical protein